MFCFNIKTNCCYFYNPDSPTICGPWTPPSVQLKTVLFPACGWQICLFCWAMRSPCLELRTNVVLFGNKNCPCQRMIIFSASFNYGCVSFVSSVSNMMCWNFFQKILAHKFSWPCLLLDILLSWHVSGLHYVDKHFKFSMPYFDKLGFQCPKFTCKVRLAYECTLSFMLKKLGCFAYVWVFLPTFELLKLEFSECFSGWFFFFSLWKILVKISLLFLNLQETIILLWFWKLLAFFFFLFWKF